MTLITDHPLLCLAYILYLVHIPVCNQYSEAPLLLCPPLPPLPRFTDNNNTNNALQAAKKCNAAQRHHLDIAAKRLRCWKTSLALSVSSRYPLIVSYARMLVSLSLYRLVYTLLPPFKLQNVALCLVTTLLDGRVRARQETCCSSLH